MTAETSNNTFEIRYLSRTPMLLASIIPVMVGLLLCLSTQAQTFTTLYQFRGSTDGAYPFTGVILDPSGNLYGDTQYGGTFQGGTLWKLTQNGVFTVLHQFGNSSDGSGPYGTNIIGNAAGTLYGTTPAGGSSAGGTIWSVDANGNESVLHNFNDTDGWQPYTGVVRDRNGNLYGTASGGGANGQGTVWKLDRNNNLSTLHFL